MDPITIGLLAGGGLGLGKGLLDQQREKKDRAAQAEIARWSPWTGMQAQPVQRADMLGSVMQGGTSGAMMGQGVGNQQAYNKYLGAMTPSNQAPGRFGSGWQYMGSTSSTL